MNDQPAERPPPSPRPASPTIRTASPTIIRFGDLDPQGHVNQAMFLDLLRERPGLDVPQPRSRHRRAGADLRAGAYRGRLHEGAAVAGLDRYRHRRRRIRPLLVQSRAGDLPRRRRARRWRARRWFAWTRPRASRRRCRKQRSSGSASGKSKAPDADYACLSGVRTTRPSSSSLTLIWHDSREFGRTS